MAKFIFITGGVVSSLGKGITAASLGSLLESAGFKIAVVKIDPYINVDPGTMNPYQHGEVYVTDDGAETDLDLGHYERFTHALVNKNSNITTGKIYKAVIDKERAGKYAGQTVQVIPHITNEIQESIKKLAAPGIDIVMVEIGGTVGDIEGLPYIEAIRQFGLTVGPRDSLYIHLTLLPYLKPSEEIKTKPTQHSVSALLGYGIKPDILVLRTQKRITKEIRDKISLFCNVPASCVIEEKDVAHSVYEVPIVLNRQKVADIIMEKLYLPKRKVDVRPWQRIVRTIRNPKREVEVAVVGKYIQLVDSYKSIFESIAHAGIANNARVKVRKVNSEDIEKRGAGTKLRGVGGILVPGGFGMRGIEGKIRAVRYAREKGIPFFGICLGLQCAVIEFARNVLGWADANSTEFEKNTAHPVISLLEEQKKVKDFGGSMRLGAYSGRVVGKKYLAFRIYRSEEISERHRHRYEYNSDFLEDFEKNGMNATVYHYRADDDPTPLVEVVEIGGHPFYIATQFHPEFKSKPTEAHPIFREWIKAAIANREGKDVRKPK